MEHILNYLRQTYHPLTILVYGSYANGTNGEGSDFDALVITRAQPEFHDTSVVHGVRLDVFGYPKATFDGDYDCSDFFQIFDGILVEDSDGIGQALQQQVRARLAEETQKTPSELLSALNWCRKMLERANRPDAEGLFRWHWLLTDSLEIFCNMAHQPYFGPKKTLRWMERAHPEAFACYEKALRDFDMDSLSDWIAYLDRFLPSV